MTTTEASIHLELNPEFNPDRYDAASRQALIKEFATRYNAGWRGSIKELAWFTQ